MHHFDIFENSQGNEKQGRKRLLLVSITKEIQLKQFLNIHSTYTSFSPEKKCDPIRTE